MLISGCFVGFSDFQRNLRFGSKLVDLQKKPTSEFFAKRSFEFPSSCLTSSSLSRVAVSKYFYHSLPLVRNLYEIISYKFRTISLLTGRYELNKLTSLPMCGFIAQLVEHRTGIAEVTGSNPVEALIFSGFFFPIA